MSHATMPRILLAFAYESARVFFRPKPSETLQLPRQAVRWLEADEKLELVRRPNSYVYIGAAVELLVATLLFLTILAIALSAKLLMQGIVESYGNIEKWAGFIDLFAGGLSFVGVILLGLFSLKLLQGLLRRALDV